jgi:hypothetical protein
MTVVAVIGMIIATTAMRMMIGMTTTGTGLTGIMAGITADIRMTGMTGITTMIGITTIIITTIIGITTMDITIITAIGRHTQFRELPM